MGTLCSKRTNKIPPPAITASGGSTIYKPIIRALIGLLLIRIPPYIDGPYIISIVPLFQ